MFKIYTKRKENPELYSDVSPTQLGYWIKKGLSEDEAKVALKERQSTFTLEKQIAKYGLEEGTRRFNERQEKWQNTLKLKPQEEIDDINIRKGINKDRMIEKYGEIEGIKRYNDWLLSTNPGILNRDISLPGKLYYIHFYNDEIEFWKIGITKLNIEGGRFANNINFKSKHNLNYDIIFVKDYDSYNECFIIEQYILKHYDYYRCSIDYNGFKTSEAFDINIFKEL